MKKIIFKNNDNSIGIITPVAEVLNFATIEQVAVKDVPYGLPWWIVASDEIPADRTFRAAWEIDPAAGPPHGYGGESHEFNTEVLNDYNKLRESKSSD